jgi:predicted phosphodiesterase
VRERLSAEQISLLHGLPEQVQLEVDGLGPVLFCHATPRNDTEIFLETTPEQHLVPLFAGVLARVVVCGHTHMQFQRDVAGVQVVNAGSVGMPYEDAPGAYWALLGPTIEHRRTVYDDSGLAAAGFPGPEGERPRRLEALAYFEPHAVGA